MIFKIITLFPDFFSAPLQTGLLGKAIASKIVQVDLLDLRFFSEDKFKRCDGYSYGGGSGMVLSPAPLFKALKPIKDQGRKIVYPSPSGSLLTQDLIEELSQESELCLVCGNYEGVDQRVLDKFVDLEVSIGDYILSGGEFSSLVIIDAISRLVPGFMSNEDSLKEESLQNDLLEYPHYTRPAEIEGMFVPDVLLSGHHQEIEKWRLKKRIEKTKRVRPDLYKRFLNYWEKKNESY